MHCFRYRMDHDYGFAPNPFWGTLTLATCKAQIRKSLVSRRRLDSWFGK